MNANNINKDMTTMCNTNATHSLCAVPSPEALLSFLRQAGSSQEQQGLLIKQKVAIANVYHLKWKYAALFNTSIH